MRGAMWLGSSVLLLALYAVGADGQHIGDKKVQKPKDIASTKVSAKLADRTKGNRPSATPAEALKIMKDFKAELLYSVPKEVEGSWVNLCVDPKGRLIVSDQNGPLYRITPPPLLANGPLLGNGLPTAPQPETKVEKLDLPLGGAHGLLWAFDSLYVMVNEEVNIAGIKPQRGLHRVRSKDGGDTFEQPEFLREVRGLGPRGDLGEHGSHAILLAPDGKSLYIVCGNQTRMMSPLAGSRVPRLWGEDHLLPRMPDGNGFMAGVLGPGGCIYKVDPDGKDWELVSTGYRNPFDAAFNRHGELFTYDADMEWDMNTPWYRPTRVCLATSGSEYGWRNGAGKWPPYYADSLPAIYNVGPGSPTGVTFGYGARFPLKYQEALFMCDWSYGKLYSLHLTPEGSAYKGELEEFLSGSPLPLTDVVVNPKDGALYFTIGGRRTQSGLYRVSYVGRDATEPSKMDDAGADKRALRHRLEALHGRSDAAAVDTAWPYLSYPDRFIAFAARTAIEHQDPKIWRDRALAEKDTTRALAALLALVRATTQDPFHHPRKPADPVPGEALKAPILEALDRLDWDKLTDAQRLDLLRVYAILFNRTGKPDEAARKKLIARLDSHYPARNRELNAELCQTLVYLEAPAVVQKTLNLLAAAPTQEEQLEYLKSLRVLRTGWTLPERSQYFTRLQNATRFKGGASLRGLGSSWKWRTARTLWRAISGWFLGGKAGQGNGLRLSLLRAAEQLSAPGPPPETIPHGFLRIMLDDALASLSDAEKTPLLKSAMQSLMAASSAASTPSKPRSIVKQWKLDQLAPIVEKGLTKRDFDRGRRLFGEARCFGCHRFDNEGGSQGPDLTIASGRYSVRDLLEKVLDPNKAISDQYAAMVFTLTDGRVVTGRIVNYHGDTMMVMTDMLDPNGLVDVNKNRVEAIVQSKVSMMPTGLLDTFAEPEILDLVAYLLSRGDRNHKMFQK